MKRIFEIHFSAENMDKITATKINKLLDYYVKRNTWIEVYDITKKFTLIQKDE